MKSKLTTHDIVVLIHELREKLLGLRADQIYDLDKKSYLIRFTKSNVKRILLLESGCRFHTTEFEWPKNPAPSGFTMKLRKHLVNKRLENITQVGCDRIVNFQFGMDAYEFHIFLELYDKGNVILTDQSLNILSLVRPHIQGEAKITPHQIYVTATAKTSFSITKEEMESYLTQNPTKSVREVFLGRVEFGPSLFSFVLKEINLSPNTKIPKADQEVELRTFGEKLFSALERGRLVLEAQPEAGGFILLDSKASKKGLPIVRTKGPIEATESTDPMVQPFMVYDQFHPTLLSSLYTSEEIITFPTLDQAVDDYFSKVEAQKIELKQKNQEREAYSKLDKMKSDQKKRLDDLQEVQEVDKKKAELIMFNQETIEQAISILRTLIANQLSWDDIWKQITEAKKANDQLALSIVKLDLLKNQITLKLSDPYDDPASGSGVNVDINLDLSAFANASKYYDLKKASARKEERTLESQDKAIKATEKKTMSSLREVATIQSIKKVRKVFWFEKFRWFISSENYVVLAGQDAQQNELLVKRYMKPTDVYLHADSHGAPTVIIKNDTAPGPVLPKTLNEAAVIAVSASGAWESKIIPAVWWVWGEQVSKSAPTGEYLPTGSFMVRGKKNFLPPTQLVLGFGFLFRLSDESIPRHANERSRRGHTSSIGEGSIQNNEQHELPSTPQQSDAVDSHMDPDSDTSSDDLEAFPDTKVEIGVTPELTRERLSSSISNENSVLVSELLNDLNLTDGTVITSVTSKAGGVTDLQKLKKAKKKDAQKKGKGDKKPSVSLETASSTSAQPQSLLTSTGTKSKRGQHGRQKKLKEKYRFQDEEERERRMQLLQAKPKVISSSVQSSNKSLTEAAVTESDDIKEIPIPHQSSLSLAWRQLSTPSSGVVDADELLGAEATPDMEINLLQTLTGSPMEEDELLFAVPVIAPYSTLQNYKFKIKLIPGSTKRGKAARSALEYFIRDKNARPREKDLLKSVKDQDLSKNFPGKVKLAGGLEKK